MNSPKSPANSMGKTLKKIWSKIHATGVRIAWGGHFDVTRKKIDQILASPKGTLANSKEVLPSKMAPYAVVGDLDGDYAAFVDLCLSAWFLDSDLQWWGGSMKVVFSGDILADIHTDGFDILSHIRILREQARKEGGDITVLAGNHEEFMIGYLVGESINQWSDEIAGILRGMTARNGVVKAEWMKELYAFGKTRKEILSNMNLDLDLGRLMLEEMTEMKLVEITGTAIHFHTPPNQIMLSLISQWGNPIEAVRQINMEWKAALQDLLLTHTNLDDARKVYKKYASVFLQTANDTREALAIRANCTVDTIPEKYHNHICDNNPDDYQTLIQSGICTVVYGHTHSILQVDGIKFLPANKKSFTLDTEPLEDDASQVSVPELHASLSEIRSKIFAVVSLPYIEKNYVSYSQAGFKQGFLLNSDCIKLVEEHALVPYFEKYFAGIFTIKQYPAGMALRFDVGRIVKSASHSVIPQDFPEDAKLLVQKTIDLIASKR